jgi:murein hydrolase activator
MTNRGLSRREGPATSHGATLARGLPALALLAALALGSSQSAFADSIVPNVKGDDKATPEMQLRGVEDTMRASEDQRRRIEADIQSIRADRARLNAALIDTTAKVQDAER